MEVKFKPSFFKDLKTLPAKVKKDVDTCIHQLVIAATLESAEGIDYKKMKGKKNEHYYRIRIGNYRIGCEYIRPDIILITVMSRGSIYKSFP
ncbi:type II toxin-antitoxin system RelE family toxin [Niabella hirudinis]|uniref:type II toxin-antitoxin system RelE family toxin n=1 Tax=Niabella hirudinis TaxID=1285929 RepID=UPI003EB791A1